MDLARLCLSLQPCRVRSPVLVTFTALILAGLSGCGPTRVTVDPTFASYRRLALRSDLSSGQEDWLIARFRSQFPSMQLLHGADLGDAVAPDQPLRGPELDRLRRYFDVQAVLTARYNRDGRREQVALTVTDTGSGQVVASVVSEASIDPERPRQDMTLIRRSVQGLREETEATLRSSEQPGPDASVTDPAAPPTDPGPPSIESDFAEPS